MIDDPVTLVQVQTALSAYLSVKEWLELRVASMEGQPFSTVDIRSFEINDHTGDVTIERDVDDYHGWGDVPWEERTFEWAELTDETNTIHEAVEARRKVDRENAEKRYKRQQAEADVRALERELEKKRKKLEEL